MPSEYLLGVPRTTFATQACDMGIIKDFKYIYRRKVREHRVCAEPGN